MNGADVVIRAEGLGKRYNIGHETERERYTSLRDVLRSSAGRAAGGLLGRRAPGPAPATNAEFWALKDVSFEIKRGEVVGIIGRNGAGKSTLLKILSRITEPTTGRVELKGRVASLLEVGTGFHPELTGRENIYLNGSILGMSRAEIRRKFDEIVAFAEVERFLDTPVKRYSSGMYVRLAFAVAAHLDAEILVVDEVLAVGDVEFQRKCLGKMESIGSSGRTVLFVSHNLQAIRRFCHRSLLLAKGALIAQGETGVILTNYLTNLRAQENSTQDRLDEIVGALPADSVCKINRVTLQQNGRFPEQVESSRPLEIVIEYEVLEKAPGLHAFFRLFDEEELLLFESIDHAELEELPVIEPGRYLACATIPGNLLGARRYEIALGLAIAHKRYCLPELIRIPFDVDLSGTINQALPGYKSPGRLLPAIPWTLIRKAART